MALQIIVGLFLYAKSLKYSILLVDKTESQVQHYFIAIYQNYR